MSDWRTDLDDFFEKQETLTQAEEAHEAQALLQVEAFLAETVLPAFEQLQEQLEKHGREVKIAQEGHQATISVLHEGKPEIMYRLYADARQPIIEYAFISAESGQALKASDVITEEDSPLPVEEIDQEAIIRHFIRKYKSVVA